jgi:endonuclease YncB( thermonuclease family)
VKLLAKDRYNRAIAAVTYRDKSLLPFLKGSEENMAEKLLENGLAVVYRQGGAQYDGSIERWNKIETAAKKKKVGIWSLDSASMELPSEFKKKARQEKASVSASATAGAERQPSKRGIRRYADSVLE